MKHIRYAIVLILCVLVLISSAYAHPGRTDANGGHHDSSTGEYHYHHGYPAHDHIDIDGDGKLDCPYEFKDKTGWNSGSTSSSSSSESTKQKMQNDKEGGVMIRTLLGIIAILIVVIAFMYFANKNAKEEAQNKIDKLKCDYEKRLADAEKKYQQQTVDFEQKRKQSEDSYLRKAKEVESKLAQLDEDLISAFGEDYIYTISKAPENCVLNDECTEIICLDGSEEYTFFLANYIYRSHVPKYHARGCRHARLNQEVNAYVLHWKRYPLYEPCLVCKPVLPEMVWADKAAGYYVFLRDYAPSSKTAKQRWKDERIC